MKFLIAVASKHGSTREIAEAVADELRASQQTVDVHDMEDVKALEHYEAVILGSAVYAGHWLDDAKDFAERFRSVLATLPVWVFSSGPLGTGDPQPREDAQRLAAPLEGLRIRDHRIFVGKLDRHELGWTERMIVGVVGAPYGDFRDWDAIRAWAREIVAAVPFIEARQERIAEQAAPAP